VSLLKDLQLPARKLACAVRTVAESLDKEDSAILIAAVMDSNWPYSTLERALFDKGITLSQGTIKRHRTKGCSCWKI